jgi:uncharacterized Zn finger protein (UPF0148 family)
MSKENQVKCPNCGTSIDVQDILSHQLEEEIKQQFQAKLAAEKKKYEAERDTLTKAKEDFERARKSANEAFQERLERSLKEEKRVLEVKLKSKLQEEQQEQFNALQK